MEFYKSEYNWTDSAVIGASLIVLGGNIDSFGNKLFATTYYEVGKHKDSGKVVIIPTADKNFEHEFEKEFEKQIMNNRGNLN